jgi:hypothetical protein
LTQEAAVRSAILTGLRLRAARERAQTKLWDEQEDFHETIRSKLAGLIDTPQYWHFSQCGRSNLYRTCKDCSRTTQFKYACNIKWCPRCNEKITRARRNLLWLWCQKIEQPKHLVLTQKNFRVITRARIRQHTRNLARMRRKAAFQLVRGGCVSVEITNEGNGWHLHSHWLLDVPWLNMQMISQAWGALVGQEFAICKIKDCRGKDYIQEVSKYVVEGSELARWPAEEINEFVRAVRGARFFYAFGSLFSEQPDIRRALALQRPPPVICECGCAKFVWEDEQDALVHEIERMERRNQRSQGRG